MRTTMGLAVGLAAFLAGCGNEAQGPGDAETKALQNRAASLKRENDTLKATVDTLRAENAATARKMYALNTENSQLKHDAQSAREAVATAEANTKAALANSRAAEAAAAQNSRPVVASPPSAPVADPVAQLEKKVAELDARIAELRPRLTKMRSELTELRHAAVDQATPVPSGCVVRNDTVYRKEPLIIAPYYQYVAIGPVIRKGDYRTPADKNDAIQKAKDALDPLEKEMKALQDELAVTKGNLLKIKAAAQPGAQPAASPAEPAAGQPAAQPARNGSVTGAP